MNKSILLGAVCALCLAQNATAQSNDGVTYVEDNSQGLIINKFKDNWFITAEGGATLELNHDDSKMKVKDRIEPAASIYFGKWFTPVFGGRLGVNWMQVKSLTEGDKFGEMDKPTIDGLYENKFSEVGPVADIMINLTNWWCGYRPGRVYNATIYGGFGGYFSYCKEYGSEGLLNGWKYADERVLTIRTGLINTFNITKNFALSLDVRFTMYDSHTRLDVANLNETAKVLNAYIAATYNFNRADWGGPVIPVCPPAEDCEPVRMQLEDASARISELEHQLEACMKRPATQTIIEKVEKEAPLATIYFPIGVSKLTAQDANVLSAVAQVMKENPNKRYTITGWADNYTGNDEINTRLRHERANSAAEYLQKEGVPTDSLTVTINAGNLSELGEKFVALDRAVTIEETK